jgi:mersacidin/lichenicidin family type 2 lantibiotic
MKLDVVRAWKDDAYRQGLSHEQLSQLPENPAGEFELAEDDLQYIYGGGKGVVRGVGVMAGAPVSPAAAASAFFNNFNRLENSFRCSIECSFDCDIQNAAPYTVWAFLRDTLHGSHNNNNGDDLSGQ